jgi:hypothetical protein
MLYFVPGIGAAEPILVPKYSTQATPEFWSPLFTSRGLGFVPFGVDTKWDFRQVRDHPGSNPF